MPPFDNVLSSQLTAALDKQTLSDDVTSRSHLFHAPSAAQSWHTPKAGLSLAKLTAYVTRRQLDKSQQVVTQTQFRNHAVIATHTAAVLLCCSAWCYLPSHSVLSCLPVSLVIRCLEQVRSQSKSVPYLNGCEQVSAWGTRPLTAAQVEYAALDATGEGTFRP